MLSVVSAEFRFCFMVILNVVMRCVVMLNVVYVSMLCCVSLH
jgi:hypothetical protein